MFVYIWLISITNIETKVKLGGHKSDKVQHKSDKVRSIASLRHKIKHYKKDRYKIWSA